jgi:hypothetical protein
MTQGENHWQWRVAKKLTGEKLKVVWAEFSTLSQAVFVMSVNAWHIQARSHLELKNSAQVSYFWLKFVHSTGSLKMAKKREKNC